MQLNAQEYWKWLCSIACCCAKFSTKKETPRCLRRKLHSNMFAASITGLTIFHNSSYAETAKQLKRQAGFKGVGQLLGKCWYLCFGAGLKGFIMYLCFRLQISNILGYLITIIIDTFRQALERRLCTKNYLPTISLISLL